MPEGTQSEDEPSTVGWDAITALLERLYPAQKPRHWGVLLSFRIGGPDPLDGISTYLHVNEPDHWHFVSYGMSELYAKEWDDKRTSGWGFEFTFRLKREPDEAEPPQWPLSLLQNLARYVFGSGNVFAPGHYLPLNGPIALEKTTAIWAAMFVEDSSAQRSGTALKIPLIRSGKRGLAAHVAPGRSACSAPPSAQRGQLRVRWPEKMLQGDLVFPHQDRRCLNGFTCPRVGNPCQVKARRGIVHGGVVKYIC